MVSLLFLNRFLVITPNVYNTEFSNTGCPNFFVVDYSLVILLHTECSRKLSWHLTRLLFLNTNFSPFEREILILFILISLCLYLKGSSKYFQKCHFSVITLFPLSPWQGYEGSFLKLISSKPGKHPQPIAFVSFKLRKQAEKALNELQVCF